MVGRDGIEPSTSYLSDKRSTTELTAHYANILYVGAVAPSSF